MQIDIQKGKDEIVLRKAVTDQMSDNLLKHENESMVKAQKLTSIKNQLMEYDRTFGTNRKYGGVRTQTLKNTPITVSQHVQVTLAV